MRRVWAGEQDWYRMALSHDPPGARSVQAGCWVSQHTTHSTGGNVENLTLKETLLGFFVGVVLGGGGGGGICPLAIFLPPPLPLEKPA